MQRPANTAIIPAGLINQKIHFLRGTRVMLDSDLAKLYGVQTTALNQAVQRNRRRFPEPGGRGGRRIAPYAFTEQGVAMLSSVLRGQRAVQVNVAIMRTFVRLREMLSTHEDLRRKIDALEKRYDARFQAVFETIRQMLETPIPAKKAIGFHAKIQTSGKPNGTVQSKRKHQKTRNL